MSNFFPTDVRVRMSRAGDEALFGVARKVLFHALHMQESGSSLPITVVQRGEDGTTITAQIGQGYKNVTIYTPPPVREEPVPILEIPVKDDPSRAATMLSGWTMRATISGDTLSAFHPTQNCAAAYNIPYAWQTNRKLATTPNQLQSVKPSMFSGTMKRIVQGLLGMGIIKDRSPLYFGGTIPSPRQALVSYGYTFDRTHGIYKAGEKNHWLVEISQTRGVLAMPLPILVNTTTGKFRALVRSRHDNGTLQMLDEFGGLPSGEDFPATGTPLEDAITAGKVLRLLTDVELEPFYTSAFAWYPGSGWAFSENGSKAHNTCWKSAALDDRCYTGNIRWNYRNGYRFSSTRWGEHWGIRISLDEHGGPSPPTGSATLEIVDRGRVDPYGITNAFFPTYDLKTQDDRLNRGDVVATSPASVYSLWDARAPGGDLPLGAPLPPTPMYMVLGASGQRIYEKWGCTVHAFFDGERLETLQWRAFINEMPGVFGTFYGSSVGNAYGIGSAGGNAFIPRFCREGYVLWANSTSSVNDPVDTVGYISGIGVLSLSPLRSPPGVYGKVLPPFHRLMVDGHPFSYYFSSFGQYDAVVNAGPDRQFFMHNGARSWPPFSGTWYPNGPPHEFVTLGTPDGIESIHPCEFNYIGGHPEGTA